MLPYVATLLVVTIAIGHARFPRSIGQPYRRQWGTRSQSIRTAAEAPFEVALGDTAQGPLYQRIAPQAQRLHQPGFTFSCIAKHLGVTDKTVAKAVAWQHWRR